MPATTYETLEGEILGETRNGVERDYVPDPLGSVAALIDSSQAKTDTFSYWPYGEERSRTGSIVTPFRFVGTLGYYRDDSGRSYVRARYLKTSFARWMSVDPLWPEESAYGYVGQNPTSARDWFGKGGQRQFPSRPFPPRNAPSCYWTTQGTTYHTTSNVRVGRSLGSGDCGSVQICEGIQIGPINIGTCEDCHCTFSKSEASWDVETWVCKCKKLGCGITIANCWWELVSRQRCFGYIVNKQLTCPTLPSRHWTEFNPYVGGCK
jgi:RHS repeat-associated protein